MGWWDRALTRLVAADPGMRRLRAAVQLIIAVVLALVAALLVLSALGQPATAVAAAAVVAMVGLLAVREGDTTARVVTTLLMVPTVVAAIALAMLAHGSTSLGEGMFLGVMFGAVYVRRFGGRASALGMVAFIGYFLALFLQAGWALLAPMAGAAAIGAAAALLARFVLLPERPAGAWRRGVRALLARVDTLRHTMCSLGEEPDSHPRRRRVHDELLRLNATALALGARFDALRALPEEEADEQRGHVLDVELAAGALVAAWDGLLSRRGDEAAPWVLAEAGAALVEDTGQVAEACRRLADRVPGAGSSALAMDVRRLAVAAADLDAAVLAMRMEPDFSLSGAAVPDGAGTVVRPAGPDDTVGVAAPGGTAGVAASGGTAGVPASGGIAGEPASGDTAGDSAPGDTAADPGAGEPAQPAGLRPTTRTAVQVVVAGALAILVGGLVATGQWFWAVITAFVVFAGTASRGELLVRAWSRSVGTVCGVAAGVVVASLVTGHPLLQVTVVLLCVFLAFYLLPISYGLMTFFITTMLGVLYGLLGRFSIAFLEIRLVETVIGALAGAVAALFVLPTRTRGVVADNLTAFCTATAELLRTAGADLRAGVEPRPLAAEARAIDDAMHTLLASAEPLGSFRFGDARARHDRWRQLISSAAAATREFARGLPLVAVTADDDTQCRLGELTDTLAELATALADRELPATADLLDRAAAAEGTLVDLVEAVQAGPTALRAALHQLGRLRGALADMVAEFGAPAPKRRPDAARAPAVRSG